MQELDRLLASCMLEIDSTENIEKLEKVKSAILGKNGRLTDIMKTLKDLDESARKKLGAEINVVKSAIIESLAKKFEDLELRELNKRLKSEFLDVTMPVSDNYNGKIHPLTKVTEEISEILSIYGLSFIDGPEIDTEFYNFTAMNMPDHHPARTMHDTFYVSAMSGNEGRKLLRTHTSTVQARAMLKNNPPFGFFSIGRVFRSDYDATHTPMFTQVEGLIIDNNIGFSNLKWIMSDLLKRFFEAKNLNMRFRPSFFPFTEPSAEADINYDIVNGKMVFGTGNNWLEIGGCGVVHPNVLKTCNIDPNMYQGIAFGLGIERLASLKYGVPDLREYFESNDRWRNTFGFYCAEK